MPREKTAELVQKLYIAFDCYQDLLPFMDHVAIMKKSWDFDGIDISDIQRAYKMFRDKRYCMLVFIKNPGRTEQFEIGKTGFG